MIFLFFLSSQTDGPTLLRPHGHLCYSCRCFWLGGRVLLPGRCNQRPFVTSWKEGRKERGQPPAEFGAELLHERRRRCMTRHCSRELRK